MLKCKGEKRLVVDRKMRCYSSDCSSFALKELKPTARTTTKIFGLLVATASAVAAFSATTHEAKAGYCWYDTAYYEKYGCTIVNKLNNGKYVLICCN